MYTHTPFATNVSTVQILNAFPKTSVPQKLPSVKNRKQKLGKAWANTHKDITKNFQFLMRD